MSERDDANFDPEDEAFDPEEPEFDPEAMAFGPDTPEFGPEATEEDREEADQVYAELLERLGEGNPQPRLEPVRRAVELLGDPHRAHPVIHITGTNGKTSTSRMIESLLRAHGLRT